MKFKMLPTILLCLTTTGAFATSASPEDEIVHRVAVPVRLASPEAGVTGASETSHTRVVRYRKAPEHSHILLKEDVETDEHMKELKRIFQRHLKIAFEMALASEGSSEVSWEGMPDDSELRTALRFFAPVAGGVPTAFNTLFTPKMIPLFPCIPTQKSQASTFMGEINSMLIAQALFNEGKAEFGDMGAMFTTILAEQGRTRALAAWANLDSTASAENLSSAPTLVTLTLYPGTSRQTTVSISPQTLGWKSAYNTFAQTQSPPLPYSASVSLLNGDSYLVQDLVNAFTTFTGGLASAGTQLDILKAAFYQISNMNWPTTMSSTFAAFLN
jgi:hypothetical protein